jgi:hypothetical protein
MTEESTGDPQGLDGVVEATRVRIGQRYATNAFGMPNSRGRVSSVDSDIAGDAPQELDAGSMIELG